MPVTDPTLPRDDQTRQRACEEAAAQLDHALGNLRYSADELLSHVHLVLTGDVSPSPEVVRSSLSMLANFLEEVEGHAYEMADAAYERTRRAREAIAAKNPRLSDEVVYVQRDAPRGTLGVAALRVYARPGDGRWHVQPVRDYPSGGHTRIVKHYDLGTALRLACGWGDPTPTSLCRMAEDIIVELETT